MMIIVKPHKGMSDYRRVEKVNEVYLYYTHELKFETEILNSIVVLIKRRDTNERIVQDCESF